MRRSFKWSKNSGRRSLSVSMMAKASLTGAKTVKLPHPSKYGPRLEA